MDFITRVFSNYVHHKMTKEESKALILGTFAILTDDYRSDEQKIKMIENVYKKVFLSQDNKEHSN
ncbi:hypothetical protein [Fictibacillus phosphorivorans]|uniref:hypothetical protein n=1 Tax=Fictibacillus phosphorivorans TaxID=1221500 RepID=UPI00203AD874|nr:hypothetical protein [Fictibacillus phosphorivorans]MCM3719180.1 hypothetical protein [Fictibacillus phosphorivorans]MCM3776802.1 hypothetical protein [Fictibacillus phosphorivorans]